MDIFNLNLGWKSLEWLLAVFWAFYLMSYLSMVLSNQKGKEKRAIIYHKNYHKIQAIFNDKSIYL